MILSFGRIIKHWMMMKMESKILKNIVCQIGAQILLEKIFSSNLIKWKLDQMVSQQVFSQKESKELLRTAYNKHNVVYHLDDGSHENSGSDMIPFDNLTTMDWFSENNELEKIYNDYFLHGNPDNWRRGVFHYGVVIYQCSMANGNAFGGGAYQISK